MPETRLAFRGSVNFSELAEYARSRDWAAETPSAHPVPGTEPQEADAYVFAWRSGSHGTARFIDDEVTEVQFIIFQGVESQAQAALLSNNFPTMTYEDCLDSLAGDISDEEREKSLETLGAIAPRDYDSSVHEAVSKGLDGNSSTIRSAAISATLQLSWTELRAPLMRVATSDPDPNNRAVASNVLHALP
ncbi:hypothetical protein [Streptomyces sp. NPDC056921]|uniref:hypothetical protein n=1 Tax=Streptomyces sp. NPDC056921 TaxID=3345966 RepID=UPI003644086B